MTDTPIIELQKKWDNFGPIFQELFEPLTMISAYSMLTHLNLHKVENVLEIGCGAGGAASLALSLMKPGSSLELLDLSPTMIKLAKERLQGNSKEIKINAQSGDAESLPFPDQSFERVYGNYVLHLVFNPDKVLKEARRVLKKGGAAAFCVWGRRENSPKFDILDEARKEVGLPTQPRAFHLSDLESTRKMFVEAGFTRVLAWYQLEPTNDSDEETFVENMVRRTPTVWNEVSKLDEEKRNRFIQVVREKSKKILDSGTPLHSEALIVVGYV